MLAIMGLLFRVAIIGKFTLSVPNKICNLANRDIYFVVTDFFSKKHGEDIRKEITTVSSHLTVADFREKHAISVLARIRCLFKR